MKGFIAFHGGEIRKTHDLVVLNHECNRHDSSFENIIDLCINLTDYGVQVWYPFHFEMEDRDVKIAVEDAETIRSLVRSLIGLTYPKIYQIKTAFAVQLLA